MGPSFFASWLAVELAPWYLFWQLLATLVLLVDGALEETRGWIGLALSVLAVAMWVAIIVRNRRTVLILRDATKDLDVDDAAPPFPKSHVVFPFLMRHRAGVTKVRNITFAEYGKKKVRLDVYKPADAKPGDLRPGILQIHGGAWIFGDKREQGIPLLNHLAANGWVGINANYRLSPRAAFPAHLIDLKKAIAWYRAHADEHGADPDFLCVTGGSAGGHLTALVALTANDPEYQPGFEDVDTSVDAAVPFYGVYDFTNRYGTWHHDSIRRFFEPIIMKTKLSNDPDAFAKASPLDRVRAEAPPFFIIHGDKDTLAPVHDAREFAARLREVSDAPVLYAEMQGAQHAFDVFPSFRIARVIEAVERFLYSVHRQYVGGRQGPEVSEREAVAQVTATDHN
jgi:acetyl esterase/lipase